MLFQSPVDIILASLLPKVIYFRAQTFSKGGTDAIKGVFHPEQCYDGDSPATTCGVW
jgi:hypothetical protein